MMFLNEKKGSFFSKKRHYRGGKFAIKCLVYKMLDNFSAITGCARFKNGWHSVSD
jgi:hypothetical protein